MLLEECRIGILSLDHDMGSGVPNGLEIVKEMVRRCLYPEEIYLHSSSAIGRMNMFTHLYQYKPEHVKLFSTPVPDELLKRAAREAFN